MVFLRIILVDIGTFDGEQNNFWNKLFKFMLFSFQQINYHENKRMASFVLNLKYLSQNLVKLYMYTAMSEWLCLKDAPVPAISRSLQQDVLCVFSMKTWSNETPNYSFRFCSSKDSKTPQTCLIC